MDKKQLEIELQKAPPHPAPKYELEQYLTPAELASQILWIAFLKGDIEGKIVIDLGCGTGIFCKGVVLLGGDCICVDIDRDALNVARNFVGKDAEYIQAEVNSFNLTRKIDTVIENPPFGVVNRGIDLKFLLRAMEVANSVYSIHKSNEKTRELIMNMVKEYGYSVELISLNYRLKYYYRWHRKRIYEFPVDLYYLKKMSNS
ncbi:MAG: METTL5 family protein [Sulfolobaceae archaeon]|nr:METTL5 family protein [Sulfolobaceae archaeon]